MDTTARIERAQLCRLLPYRLGYVVMVRGLGFEPSLPALRERTIPDVSLPREFYGR